MIRDKRENDLKYNTENNIIFKGKEKKYLVQNMEDFQNAI